MRRGVSEALVLVVTVEWTVIKEDAIWVFTRDQISIIDGLVDVNGIAIN